ncbi:MAG TPA: tetratricopeptide repeat protein [Gemmatimonadota bacterium]|nr:tetratricopeptide repeat protein [Gemmatimonadota bacterium]
MTRSGSQQYNRASRRGQVTRVLFVYLGVSFAVLESADIFTEQLGLPHWFFVGTMTLLIVGLPVVLLSWLLQDLVARRRLASSAHRAELAGEPGESPAPELRVAGPDAAATPGTWLTWRRALLGGVAIVAVWGVFIAGYVSLREMGSGPVGSLVAAGVLDEREPIILSDFESNASDPLLGRAATEAFRIDLSQSTAVTLVPAGQVDRALILMRADPQRKLDERLAREVAVREGIKAVIAGDITPVGTGYVLSARLVAAEDGRVLTATRQTADDSTRIISAIDQLSKQLRERIGESLRTIQRSEPLDHVTTGSLEALRVYSQAVSIIEQGEHERALTLLEEAVALDSTFAMAWRKLGITLGNLDRDRARQIEALTQAYERRDRLSDRERLLTEGSYYAGVTGENERAAAAYQALLDLHPDDTWALNNQALIFLEQRDYQRANRGFERAIQVDSSDALFYGNLMTTLAALDEFDQAESIYQRLGERFPEHPSLLIDGPALASARFDYDLAEERLREAQDKGTSNRMMQLGLAFSQAQLYEIRGQLSEATAVLEQVALAFEQQGDYANYIGTTLRIAFYDLLLRGQPQRGIERLEQALARRPLDEMDPLERPYTDLAVFYALAGLPDRARPMIEAGQGKQDRLSDEDEAGLAMARALLAVDAGRADEAVQQVRLADRGACSMCVLPAMGLIYDLGGQTDSVVAIYERYLDTPWLYRLASADWWALASVYERLAGIYELRGDREQAMQYYSRFIELWKDADPELRPRVEAAQAALERLAAETNAG